MRHHKRCWLIQTAGRWPWKSESAKECVTTHLPNQLALKMDGARASGLYRTVAAVRPSRAATHAATSRQVAAVAWKAGARARLERPRVQILVVVANIQTRTLKTEVEKGSM